MQKQKKQMKKKVRLLYLKQSRFQLTSEKTASDTMQMK